MSIQSISILCASLTRSQMFEGTYAPPRYLDMYNFKDGAQNDIFIDSYAEIPPPSPNSTVVPVLQQPQSTAPASSPSTTTSAAQGAPTSQPTDQVPFGTPPGRCSVW